MTKQELWALIEHHANQITGRVVASMMIRSGVELALDTEHHGKRICELAQQVYGLEKKDAEAASDSAASQSVSGYASAYGGQQLGGFLNNRSNLK